MIFDLTGSYPNNVTGCPTTKEIIARCAVGYVPARHGTVQRFVTINKNSMTLKRGKNKDFDVSDHPVM